MTGWRLLVELACVVALGLVVCAVALSVLVAGVLGVWLWVHP